MANPLNLNWQILKDRYEGELDSSNQTFYQMKVDEAVRLLLRKCPGLQDRIEKKLLDIDFVHDVVAKAVLRVIRNPEGFTSESEGNYSYSLGNRVASGDLWYQDSELADLGCGSLDMPRSTRIKLGW